MKNKHVIHIHICLFIEKQIESLILVYGISTVWEDTNGCAIKYGCNLAIYVMDMLSSSYGLRMYHAINEPGHGNNVLDAINATNNRYLR